MSAASPAFEIVPATALLDVELLRPVLLSAIRNPVTREVVYEDVEDILASVPRNDTEMATKYSVVALSSETSKALGMMSLMSPGVVMRNFAQSSNPIELTNAYVLDSARGLGVGSSLVRHLEDHAMSQGYTEIILNSGPRFRFSGWPFWRHQYGEPVAVAANYYGPRLDAPVWRTSLTQEK